MTELTVDHARRVIDLPDGVYLAGSCPLGDIHLEHGAADVQAILHVSAKGFVVLHGGSGQPTRLNGRAVRRAEAGVGDTLTLGAWEFRIERVDSSASSLASSTHENPARRARERAPGPSIASILKRMAEALAHASGVRLTPAFSILCREAGFSGVYAGTVHATGQLVLWTGSGDLDENMGATLLEAWEARSETESSPLLVRSEGLAALMDGAAEAPPVRVVFAVGEAQVPVDIGSVLRAVYRFCAQYWPNGWRVREKRAQVELSMPQGYIPSVSSPMLEIYAQLRLIVRTDLPILIVGETGTGKDVFAKIVHRSSSRRDGPLVAINCAAVPATLLEAELFGIGERVATGVSSREGKIRQADGGTLFLDEIGEMPLELQAKLLRVLEDQYVEPVGERPVKIDIGVVAATNVDIESRLESGDFRRDLFFRLAGSIIELPPLRERREDIQLLGEYFSHRFARAQGKTFTGFTAETVQLLKNYDWPGNVRELEHEVARLVHLCADNRPIERWMVSRRIREGSPKAPVGEAAPSAGEPEERGAGETLPTLELETLERMAILEALRLTRGRVSRAAERLGISRHQLRRRMQKHHLALDD